jgi:serine/threonine protein kinase
MLIMASITSKSILETPRTPPCTWRAFGISTEVLGKGSFGSVAQGTDPGTQSPVAVKIEAMKAQTVITDNMRQILNETPHAVRYRTVVAGSPQKLPTEPQLRYTVMDLVPGITLDNYIGPNRKNINWPVIQTILRQTAEALAFLHAKNIGLFDLKPENIMINLRTGNVTLIDTGGARTLPIQASDPNPIMSFGTVAPEWLLNRQGTSAFDIWSLGCTLFPLLSNKYFLYTTPELKAGKDRIQQANHTLQVIVQRIGKPLPDYLRGCRNARVFFDDEGEFRTKVELPQLAPWRVAIKTNAEKNGWPSEEVESVIKILDRIFCYENRITAEEILQSPLAQQEIAIHLDFDRSCKNCKLYLRRASSVSKPLEALVLSDMEEAELIIDFKDMVPGCIHLLTDPQNRYILVFEKEGVLIRRQVILKNHDTLDVRKFQQMGKKVSRNLLDELTAVEEAPAKKSKKDSDQENRPTN